MAIESKELTGAFDEALDLIERDEVDAAIEKSAGVIAQDFRFESVFGIGVEGRAYEGPDGFGNYLRDLTDAFKVTYADRSYDDDGEPWVFYGTLRLKGRGSDVEVNQPIAIVAERDDEGKVLNVKTELR